LLLMRDDYGYLPLHAACYYKLDCTALRLILDTAVEHGIIQEMLEAKVEHFNCSCLDYAFRDEISAEFLCLLLGYLSKYTDLTKMLEEKNEVGWNRLHKACHKNLSPNLFGILVSFFPSKEVFENARTYGEKPPIEYAKRDEIKHMLQDTACWHDCRLWLLQNHEETFLYSLYPNSLDKTCQALKEVTENGLQHCRQRATIMLIALMTSPSKFREAINKTTTSSPMSRYFDVVKRGDEKSDYNHWRKNIHLFRDFYGQWPPSERKTATTFEGEDSSSCVVQ